MIKNLLTNKKLIGVVGGILVMGGGYLVSRLFVTEEKADEEVEWNDEFDEGPIEEDEPEDLDETDEI